MLQSPCHIRQETLTLYYIGSQNCLLSLRSFLLLFPYLLSLPPSLSIGKGRFILSFAGLLASLTLGLTRDGWEKLFISLTFWPSCYLEPDISRNAFFWIPLPLHFSHRVFSDVIWTVSIFLGAPRVV